MANYNLKDKWTNIHTKAFIDLKAAMTAEPVLKGPKWDGTPFIITTDGCQDAFGAVLMQIHPTKWEDDSTPTPTGVCIEQNIETEEKYKPFLLEFAALKFGLDKFSDITWGFPIKIETDWEASTGLTQDIFHIESASTPAVAKL